jgi:hypothetical protein
MRAVAVAAAAAKQKILFRLAISTKSFLCANHPSRASERKALVMCPPAELPPAISSSAQVHFHQLI